VPRNAQRALCRQAGYPIGDFPYRIAETACELHEPRHKGPSTTVKHIEKQACRHNQPQARRGSSVLPPPVHSGKQTSQQRRSARRVHELRLVQWTKQPRNLANQSMALCRRIYELRLVQTVDATAKKPRRPKHGALLGASMNSDWFSGRNSQETSPTKARRSVGASMNSDWFSGCNSQENSPTQATTSLKRRVCEHRLVHWTQQPRETRRPGIATG
jgi:hypothetical protein